MSTNAKKSATGMRPERDRYLFQSLGAATDKAQYSWVKGFNTIFVFFILLPNHCFPFQDMQI